MLCKIVEDKINSLIQNEETPWMKLVGKIESDATMNVFDEAYEQFPNYALRIDIRTNSIGRYINRESVYLVISLLTKYFTVFLREDLLVCDGDDKQLKLICLSETKSSDDALEIINKLKLIASEMFSSHTFIHHKALFNFRITGAVPHGEDETNPERFSIFSFLFGHYHFIDRTVVFD
jgi:hypothetical protein